MYKIMIVDDEQATPDMISQYITSKMSDFEITNICNNGQEALAAFERSPVDIVLVDIRMPVMDGLTFLEQLNQATRDYIPIVISGYGEFEYAKTAMRLGVVHYLLKPLDFKELSQALEAAVQSLKNMHYTKNTSRSCLKEIQEIYFQNIIGGKYAGREAAMKDFTNATLPISYDKNGGFYIQVDYLDTAGWTYGQDSIVTAISNLLTFLYRPLFLIPVVREKSSCRILLFCEKLEPDTQVLCRTVVQLLNISISVRLLQHFASVEQLRMPSSAPSYPPPAISTDGNITEETLLSVSDARANIEKAVQYIEEHYGEDLMRDSVAAAVYMSGAHFSRCFKLIKGVSYKDYLTELRMQKAIALLATNKKISEISTLVGYSSPNRFNINFRQYTSYSPSEYRSKVLKVL